MGTSSGDHDFTNVIAGIGATRMNAYDPLSYENLAQSVVNAMMARDPARMPPSSSVETPDDVLAALAGSLAE